MELAVTVVLELLFAVVCWGIQWKAMNDFKDSFEGYAEASKNTISHIQHILDDSKTDAETLLNNTYSKNPVVRRIARMKSSDNNTRACYANFIDEDHMKFLLENQIYQLQIPLRRRLVKIRERFLKINSSIEIYERVAATIFRGCESLREKCFDETNEWLRSTIYSLSCAVHPTCLVTNNLSNHSIRKRTICHLHDFKCEYGKCITGNSYCDGECDCADCSDEPSDCVKNCSGFRCGETFHCIPSNKKCDGKDDCGDGTDEEECGHIVKFRSSYRLNSCSGEFLCRNMKCVGLKQVCDGRDDCGDWSDEDDCNEGQCSPECERKGRVCFRGPKGPECLYECPSGTYETSQGCNLTPEPPFKTLAQFLDDTPRLTRRYKTRLMILQKKTMGMFYKSLEAIVKCKKRHSTFIKTIYRNQYPPMSINEGNVTGKLREEARSDENRDKNKTSTNITLPTNQDPKVIDDSLTGKISNESGSDENLAKNKPSTSTKTTDSDENSTKTIDDGNLGGIPSDKHDEGKIPINPQIGITTSNLTSTQPIARTGTTRPNYDALVTETAREDQRKQGRTRCKNRKIT